LVVTTSTSINIKLSNPVIGIKDEPVTESNRAPSTTPSSITWPMMDFPVYTPTHAPTTRENDSNRKQPTTPSLPTHTHKLPGASFLYADIASLPEPRPMTNSEISIGNPINNVNKTKIRKNAPPPLIPVT